MIRKIEDFVLAFDCEWIPDPNAARLIRNLPPQTSDEEALKVLFELNGATEENPTPFVRYMHSRVVSIAMVRRVVNPQTQLPEVALLWMPKDFTSVEACTERDIIGKFIAAIGRRKPQVVGFNSRSSDLRLLAQRALALGIPAKGFLARPEKPWTGVDYLGRDNDSAIDLMDCIVGNAGGKSAYLSLHEACTLCGIPGKFDAHGDEVWELHRQGKIDEIVHYNCFDALSTYLLWLRVAFVSGLFDETQYEEEQELLRQHLMELAEKEETAFVATFLEEWDRLLALKESF